MNKLFRFINSKFLISFGVAFLLGSCVTMGDYNFHSVDRNLETGNYEGAAKELEDHSGFIYTARDKVLVGLDEGILCHYRKMYGESNTSFEKAEQLIQEYRAASISQMLISAVTNDTVIDYEGEDFENIYSSIFMALNYAALGKPEDVMVELRRADNKIKLLKLKYQEQIKAADRQIAENGVSVSKVDIAFNDSALARYLSLIVYRSLGDEGNAEVDVKYLRSIFKNQPVLYDFSQPSCIEQELSVPGGMARLNVLAFSGKAPVKKESIIRIPWHTGNWYKLALPVMEKRESAVNSISVTAVNKATGEKTSAGLEKIESIENIAMDTFRQHYSLIYARSLARSISRQAVSSAVNSATKEVSDPGAALILATFDIAHMIATEVMERADVRCSRYFPASASVTGINLVPGNYSVTVDYKQNKKIIYSETFAVTVKKGGLNLVESVSLR